METTNAESILDGVQLGLDVVGLIPGLGEPLDEINAGISLARGNYGDALLSLAAMYPFGGQAATATKLGRKAGAAVLENLDKADEAVAGISRMGDELSHMILNQPCFPAGTPILTPFGSIPIDQLKPGDHVLSRREDDVHAPVELQEVEQVYVRQSEVYELTVGGQTIRTTGEHPFWVKGHGWVAAAQLEAGDEFSTHTGAWIPLEAIRYTGETVTVYNFRVANTHTYFVGDDNWGFSVWVHNTHLQVSVPAGQKGPLWTSAGSKRGVENAYSHFQKHGSEFPEYLNAMQYARGAREFVTNAGPGMLTKVRQNGDTLFFDPATNTFAVQRIDGALRTMFRPLDGINYWNRL